jgi:hypothetical protein
LLIQGTIDDSFTQKVEHRYLEWVKRLGGL